MGRAFLLALAYLVIPGILGLILWAATDDQSVAFLSGLLFAVLAMGIESRVAEGGHRNDIFKAIGLGRKVAANQEIEALVSSYEGLLAQGSEFERALAASLVTECQATVQDLLRGSCRIPETEVPARSIWLVKAAKDNVFATSVVENWAFWRTGPGQEYWLACRDAVDKRGVKMIRIFMPKSRGDLDADAKALIHAQLQGGVDARIAFVDDLEARSLRFLIVDFAMFDDHCAVALQFQPGSRSSILCGEYCRKGTQGFTNLQSIRNRLLMEAAPANNFLL